MMIDKEQLRDRVMGCWIGKAVGGTLGMPFEGCADPLDVSMAHMAGQMLPNDDLELQLLWIHVLEQRGLATRAADLAQAAADHYVCYPDEYGVARWNTWRGLKPPLTGSHNNAFGDGMGAAIRSEIWACIAAGRPRLAAALAREDALVDHHGNGVYAEMLLAALESRCFTPCDVTDVVASGLEVIPADCRLAQAVRYVCDSHADGHTWNEIRQEVGAAFPSYNFTDVTLNLTFIVMGMLFGAGDADQSLTLAVNGGMDTDCTGATCGSILGLLLGASGLPDTWRRMAGDNIVFHESLSGLPLPRTLEELTDRTLALHAQWVGMPDAGLEQATPETAPPIDDPHDWLIFRYAADEVLKGEPDVIAMAERDPASARSAHRRFNGIHLDLSDTVQRPGDVLYLLTWLRVDQLPASGETYLMCCADAGITVWWDDQRVLDYHGRHPAIPAFHRTEGGATVPVSLTAGRWHQLKIRLLCGSGRLTCTAAIGDALGRYLQPVRYGCGFVLM